MSQYADEVSKMVEELRQWARKNGWAESIYIPYHPLVITRLYEHTAEDVGD